MLTLSAAGFVAGTDFTCSKTACVAPSTISVAYATFWALQKATNALAAALGLKDRIATDGKIGDQTVDLIQLIAITDGASPMLQAYYGTTKQEVAQNAAALAGEVGRLLQAAAGPSVDAIVPGAAPAIKPKTVSLATINAQLRALATQLPSIPKAGTTVTVDTSAMPLLPIAPTKYVIGGLVGAGLLLLGGLAIAQRRKRAKAA